VLFRSHIRNKTKVVFIFFSRPAPKMTSKMLDSAIDIYHKHVIKLPKDFSNGDDDIASRRHTVNSSTGSRSSGDEERSQSQSSSKHGSSRSENGRHTKARRASHRLKHHSQEVFGREYAMFPTSVSYHEARKTVGGAYAGYKDRPGSLLNNWLLEPLHLNQDDLVEASRCTNGYPLHGLLRMRGGVLFGVKDDATENKPASLKACTIFREYDPANEGKKGIFKEFTCLLCRTCAFVQMKLQPEGIPTALSKPKDKDSRDIARYELRSEYLELKLSEWHRTYGPQKSHWHLTNIAVLPEAQNKGLGTEMMKTLQTLADHYKSDCYLECAGKEIAEFFQKFGFIVVGEEKLCDDDDHGVGCDSFPTVFLMVRKAARIKVKMLPCEN